MLVFCGLPQSTYVPYSFISNRQLTGHGTSTFIAGVYIAASVHASHPSSSQSARARHVVLLSILAALASLHAQGLCHGHVTPGRILFSSPNQSEEGAATAKLCFLQRMTGETGTPVPGPNAVASNEKDLR